MNRLCSWSVRRLLFAVAVLVGWSTAGCGDYVQVERTPVTAVDSRELVSSDSFVAPPPDSQPPEWLAHSALLSSKPPQGDYRFACDLYARLGKSQTGNLFVSPTSLSTALAMTYAGARGKTAEEMAQVLRLEGPAEQTHAEWGKRLTKLRSERTECQLLIANRIWLHQGYPFEPSFLAINRDHYQADPELVDFANRPDESAEKINHWAAEKTNGKIPTLIAPGVLDPQTRIVLTNAVYFHAKWESRFRPEETRPAPFHLSDGETVEVPLMHQKQTFRVSGAEGLRLLELPYQGGQFSLVVLLPDTAEGLAELEAKLTSENLTSWLVQLTSMEVDVYLPKFRSSSSLRLVPTLREMGMPSAFQNGAADFKGMSATGEIYVSEVLQKTFVELDEEGTEAAAATAVIGMRGGISGPTIFRADHPFLYLIREHSTGELLFVGRMSDPSKS